MAYPQSSLANSIVNFSNPYDMNLLPATADGLPPIFLRCGYTAIYPSNRSSETAIVSPLAIRTLSHAPASVHCYALLLLKRLSLDTVTIDHHFTTGPFFNSKFLEKLLKSDRLLRTLHPFNTSFRKSSQYNLSILNLRDKRFNYTIPYFDLRPQTNQASNLLPIIFLILVAEFRRPSFIFSPLFKLNRFKISSSSSITFHLLNLSLQHEKKHSCQPPGSVTSHIKVVVQTLNQEPTSTCSESTNPGKFPSHFSKVHQTLSLRSRNFQRRQAWFCCYPTA